MRELEVKEKVVLKDRKPNPWEYYVAAAVAGGLGFWLYLVPGQNFDWFGVGVVVMGLIFGPALWHTMHYRTKKYINNKDLQGKCGVNNG